MLLLSPVLTVLILALSSPALPALEVVLPMPPGVASISVAITASSGAPGITSGGAAASGAPDVVLGVRVFSVPPIPFWVGLVSPVQPALLALLALLAFVFPLVMDLLRESRRASSCIYRH